MTIDLPPESFDQVRQVAERFGLTPGELTSAIAEAISEMRRDMQDQIFRGHSEPDANKRPPFLTDFEDRGFSSKK